MSKFALVGASLFNLSAYQAHDYEVTIAVDGGFGHLVDANIVPDAAIGDFDSLGYVPDACHVIEYPSHKDASDMELALDEAIRRGADAIDIYGGLGGRFDHSLANCALARYCASQGIAATLIGADVAVLVLDGKHFPSVTFDRFDATVCNEMLDAPYISVFSYGGCAHGVSERGLKYTLDSADLPDDCSRGLSNEFIGDAVLISVASGCLYVTIPCAALSYMHRSK